MGVVSALFFFSSRRRHTRFDCDWSSDVCSSDLALVGEAAHVIHPIAGQGLNLGIRDVAALAELVIDTRRLGLDIGDAEMLSRYQRWRRFDALALAAVTDGLNRLFSNTV